MTSADEEKPALNGVPDDFPLFEDRYTDQDEDYARTLKAELPPPPCVENWYVRPKRTYDWTRGDSNRGRGDRRDRGNRSHYAGRREDNRYNPYHRGGGGRGGGGGGYHDRRDNRHYDNHRNDRREWNQNR